MACGCAKTPGRTAQPKAGTLGPIHERAALCQFCPHADHGAGFWTQGATECTITGKAILEHVTGAPCPRGYHPDGRGITRWLGVRWYGVPYPIRVLLWAFGASHRRPGAWGRCGCLVWLKSILANPSQY